MVGTATTPRPLNAKEQANLADLLQRAIIFGQSPQAGTRRAAKVGSKYQALTNLSVPRPDNQTDLVRTGETVTLTDDEAALFLPPHKPFPMIRPIAEASGPIPFQHPRQHWGAERGVPGPMFQGGPVEQGGARPDPPGSTYVTTRIIGDGPPEAHEPQPGDEGISQLAHELGLSGEQTANAMDLPPNPQH